MKARAEGPENQYPKHRVPITWLGPIWALRIDPGRLGIQVPPARQSAKAGIHGMSGPQVLFCNLQRAGIRRSVFRARQNS